MITTTAGQLLINDVLPEDMRQYNWALDKKGTAELFRQLHDKHPDKYREVAQKLMTLGHFNAQASGSSFSLKDLQPDPEVAKKLAALRQQVHEIAQSDLPADKKSAAIQQAVLAANEPLEKELMERAVGADNGLALQVRSGGRGNSSQFKQILLGDMLVQDHRNRIIPVPLLHGYAEGTEPAEYFAGSYGARQGTASTKFATRDAGFLGKQLALVAHRLTVSEHDCGTAGGLPVDGGDGDNIGAILAHDVGPHKAGTVITAPMLKDLAGKPVTIRSPLTCQAHHGVCAKCVGRREKGRLPDVGDNVGMAAAQAIGEPLAQGMLSAKHTGGAVSGSGKRNEQSGFDYINSLVQVPKSFHSGATVAQVDGRITQIDKAPQGGWYIHVNGEPHYVHPENPPTVKIGDKVDAGDVMSEGTANPAEIVQHKGIGEGRRQFVETFSRALTNSGVKAHRRNVELIARGLINHVKVHDVDGLADAMPDDIVPYDVMAPRYEPRSDAKLLTPERAVGHYLEKPALHYTIGTRITANMAKELTKFGVPQVHAHEQPPAFSPHMVRGMEIGLNDPNWQTRLAGSYLQKGTLRAAQRGQSSPIHDTSYVPSLAAGTEFGAKLKTEGIY